MQWEERLRDARSLDVRIEWSCPRFMMMDMSSRGRRPQEYWRWVGSLDSDEMRLDRGRWKDEHTKSSMFKPFKGYVGCES